MPIAAPMVDLAGPIRRSPRLRFCGLRRLRYLPARLVRRPGARPDLGVHARVDELLHGIGDLAELVDAAFRAVLGKVSFLDHSLERRGIAAMRHAKDVVEPLRVEAMDVRE